MNLSRDERKMIELKHLLFCWKTVEIKEGENKRLHSCLRPHPQPRGLESECCWETRSFAKGVHQILVNLDQGSREMLMVVLLIVSFYFHHPGNCSVSFQHLNINNRRSVPQLAT